MGNHGPYSDLRFRFDFVDEFLETSIVRPHRIDGGTTGGTEMGRHRQHRVASVVAQLTQDRSEIHIPIADGTVLELQMLTIGEVQVL